MNKLLIVCKSLGIPKYSKLTKREAENMITRWCAAIKIQRFFRKKMVNGNRCPISLDPIKYPCFSVFMGTKVIYYNAKYLGDYFESSGNFKDPIFQIEMNHKQINDLQTMTKNKKLSKLFENKEHFKKQKMKEEELLNHERIVDSLGIELLNIIDNNIENSYHIFRSYLQSYTNQLKIIGKLDKNYMSYLVRKNIENLLLKTSKEEYNYNQLEMIMRFISILQSKNSTESNILILQGIEDLLFKVSKDNYNQSKINSINIFMNLILQLKEDQYKLFSCEL